MALAVLTKGLLAIVVVGLASLLYIAISGEWRRWREFRLFTGTLLFLAIAAPWHILAGIRNPHFFWFYFVNEHFMRFLGKRIPKDYNKQTNSLYWTLHLVWLFPWSLYLPVALRRPIAEWMARRKLGAAKIPRPPLTFRSRTELLCLAWAGVTLVFFSFSTNQEYYTFPAYLPILLLIAARLADEEELGSRRWLLWTSGVLALICIAFSAVLAAGLWNSRHIPFVPDIGTVLAKPNLASRNAFDGAHARSDGRVFRRVAPSGDPGRYCIADRPGICILAAAAWRPTRRDVDNCRHHGSIPDRGTHRSGALRPVSWIATHGSRNCSRTQADGPRDDLRRSIIWLVAAVLFEAAD